MAKPIKFNGTIYNSASEAALANTLKVVVKYDHGKNKQTIEYRVYCSDTTFMNVSKYQAKRAMSSDQLAMADAFDWVKLTYKGGFSGLQGQIDRSREIKAVINKVNDLTVSDISELEWTRYTMADIFKERAYSEL